MEANYYYKGKGGKQLKGWEKRLKKGEERGLFRESGAALPTRIAKEKDDEDHRFRWNWVV